MSECACVCVHVGGGCVKEKSLCILYVQCMNECRPIIGGSFTVISKDTRIYIRFGLVQYLFMHVCTYL